MQNSSEFDVIVDSRIPSELWQRIAGAWHLEDQSELRFPCNFITTGSNIMLEQRAEHIKIARLTRIPGRLKDRRIFVVVPHDEESATLLAEWSKAAAAWHEERLTHGLRVQIETMVAIGRGREGNLKRACEERDLLRLTVNALDVDDRNRVLKLAAALMKHAVQEVCRSGNPDGSPKVTGLRCKECDAEIDYEKAALLEHKPGCIVAGFFDA